MALKSTVYKVSLQIADIDHAYYADHTLTIARHPSETDERMMIRLVAFILQAHLVNDLCNGDANIAFGAGLANVDEPDVWLKDYTERIRLWIEVGQPDDRTIARACGRADKVQVYCYHHAAAVWWKAIQRELLRHKNLTVYQIDSEVAATLASMAQRNMNLQATIQDGELSLTETQLQAAVNLSQLYPAVN
jgi:uncharacterized protein YaeQ